MLRESLLLTLKEAFLYNRIDVNLEVLDDFCLSVVFPPYLGIFS